MLSVVGTGCLDAYKPSFDTAQARSDFAFSDSTRFRISAICYYILRSALAFNFLPLTLRLIIAARILKVLLVAKGRVFANVPVAL